ncbi:MAG: calcium-binding protein, partial [Candidatus Saccharibacteria bacterium]|nr:calcium-binding protein [Candidatus Saccharibacteria bacterium]
RLGYAADRLIFERTNYGLRIRAHSTTDAVTVSDWYYNNRNKIEVFTDANGRTMAHTQVESLIQAMASFRRDTGLSWEQGLSERPDQVRSIVQEYWTVPTA